MADSLITELHWIVFYIICGSPLVYALASFAVMEEPELTIVISDYTKSESRVFGYLSEVLLNVWVEANGLKVKYLPFVVKEDISRKK